MKNLKPVFLCMTLLFVGLMMASAQERLPQFLQHKVKPGETINAISEEYHVPVEDLLLLNNFPKNVELKTNQVVLIRMLNDGEQATKLPPDYKVAGSASSPAKESEEAAKEPEYSQPEKTAPVAPVASSSNPVNEQATVGPDGTKYKVSQTDYHLVQKGQTLYRISLIYGISVDKLKELNHLSSNSVAVGEKLRIR